MKTHKMPPLASLEGVSRHYSIGKIIQVETGYVLSFDQFIEKLASKDLIFIGEVHDNPEHHLIQVQILQALMARHGSLTVAMEFFKQQQQPIIDKYIKGQTSESEFLKDVDWSRQWSFDYSFYRPIMLEIKGKAGEVLAINAPNTIVKKVARSGLNSLDSNDRLILATNIDLSNEKHRSYLKNVFKDEAHKKMINFDFFYEAQCVWEDTMAENIAASLEGTSGPLVVLTGNGHIINKFGVPNRTYERIPADMTTILLTPLEGQITITKESADYVWLTGKYSRRSQFFSHKSYHKK